MLSGTARFLAALAVFALGAQAVTGQEGERAGADGTPDQPPRLNLPEWNPDPEDLPPELRPLDVVLPELPEGVAEEVAELEARIAEIEGSWLDAETREEQDAALDEAIGLAERVLAIRVEHQGNTEERVRWRDAEGEPSEWYEVIDARQQLEDLRLFRELDSEDRAALASIEGTKDEFFHMYGEGKFAEAQTVTERQLDIHRRVLGGEHPSTLLSIGNMGVLFESQGKLAEAEPYSREALESRRRVLGDEHPDTLASINNMGNLLRIQGRLSEAEAYYREALEGFRRVLGDEHTRTLVSISNMGFLLRAQGRLADAEPYTREALEVRRRVLDDEHPHTLASMNNMGALLDSQGRLSEAEAYYREALEGFRRVLGDEHPHTLISIANMGYLLISQDKLREAQPYTGEALEGFRRVLGDEHPQTLTSSNMSFLFGWQGFDSPGGYEDTVLAGHRRVLGDEHPDTLASINNMGALLEFNGYSSYAEPYYREALEGFRRVLGDEHPSTLISIANMGYLLISQGRLSEAELLFAEAFATAERLRVNVLGGAQVRAQFAGRLNLTGIAFGYALVLLGLDRADEALEVLERGRGRAGLDLFAGGRSAAEEALRATADANALSRYDAALAAEEQARLALFEAEARLSAAPDEDKPEWTQRVHDARRAMNERTAAVFNELRGLVPAVDPLNTQQMLAALKPGEALLTWSWTGNGVIALVARDGEVQGVTLTADRNMAEAFHTSSAGIGLAALGLDRDETDALAEEIDLLLSELIAAQRAGRDAVWSFHLASFRDAVLPDTLRELLAGATSVIAVTDGPLSGVPVELLLPETPVAYAPSATIALRPRLSPRTDTAIATSAGVVLGDPVFAGQPATQPGESDADPLLALAARSTDALAAGASALEQVRFYGGGLTPLPNTRLEAAAVAAMLGEGAALLLGADATAPHLRAAVEASPPRVLHLATHGLLGSSDRPLLASLALTTPDEPTTDDIGFVTLGDILATWGAQLRGTELVVLSACDTAHGVRQGDTMMALPLGLLVCGADTVVASLWKVDDRATALLMARFYANWLGRSATVREVDGQRYSPGEPLPKLAALREAQSWLRSLTAEDLDRLTGAEPDAIAEAASRGPSPRRGRLITQTDVDRHPYDHPYYWAAFVLYGSPE